MLRGHFLVMLLAWVSCCLFDSRLEAWDSEFDQMKKFQNQNKTAAAKLKQEAVRLLAQSSSPSEQPEKDLESLRKLLASLSADTVLPRDERATLVRKLQDRVRECKELVEKKQMETLHAQKSAEEQTNRPFKGGAHHAEVPPREPKIKVKQAAVAVIINNPGRPLVPDGGVRHLGGFSYLMEERSEFGTPILGGIPYLGRLFRNVGSSSISGGVNVYMSARIISP